MGKPQDLKKKTIDNKSDPFVCPECHIRLIKLVDETSYSCEKCGAKFIFRDGIYDLYPKIPFAGVDSINFAELYQALGKYPMAEDAEGPRRDATVSMVTGGRILEIGCASGLMTEHLVKRGDVYATDISMSYLKKVRTRVSDVTLVRVDAHKLPFDGLFFDNVLVTDVLEHVLVPYRVMEEIHRVLKPKGKLILGMPNILNLSNIVRHLRSLKPNKLLQYADAHISFYDPAGLFQVLAATGFEVKKYQPIYPFSIARNILPKIMVKFFDKLFGRIACYFSREMLVVAQKSEKNYWATLKTAILRKKALLLQNKHG